MQERKMLSGPVKTIVAFISTAILTIFVVALAESISAGFAGFWGGLPFWLIVIFVLSLAIYDFVDDCIGIGDGLKKILHIGATIFAGASCAFGAWQASKFVSKWEFGTFSLPFSDTEHMVSSGWLSGFWIVIAIVSVLCCAALVSKIIKNNKNSATA